MTEEGERFGQYVLRRELASGGMATVYDAVRIGDDGFERRVAIKRIHPHLSKDPAFVDMFLDEARLAARIGHPNVCQVIDYGKHQGASFLAMEFLDGKALNQVAAQLARRDAGLDRARADSVEHLRFVVTLVIEAAEGLHAAHELRGTNGELLEVVHRDVSPQNLFVTFQGELKVVDFGVASARDKIHHTETGEIKGKLAYMAPEQIHGHVDRRSDVWALGVVLWELLVLARLFRRNTQPEILVAVERDTIRAPSLLRPGIPAALDEVVMAALAREPSARVPDARALADRLRGVLAGSGGALSRRELAEWMHRLFHDEEIPVSQDPQDAVSTRIARASTGSPTPSEGAAEGASSVGSRSRRSWVALASSAGLFALLVFAFGSRPLEPIETAPDPVDVPAAPEAAPVVASSPADSSPAPAIDLPGPSLDLPGPSLPPEPEVRPEPTPSPPVRLRVARVLPTESEEPEPEPVEEVGPSYVFVRAGQAVCFDRPCSDRSEATFGPRRRELPSGEHEVHYIEAEGPSSGPAETLRVGHIRLRVGDTTHL